MRKIPIFLSCQTQLNSDQQTKREIIINILDDLEMEPRSLGTTDYPKESPLKEVCALARHCSGGIILGFEQLLVENGIYKRGTEDESIINESLPISTPWNQLEAGILFELDIPLLIFKENNMKGGIFDKGVTELYIHKMPPIKPDESTLKALRQVILRWNSDVLKKYYNK